MMRYAHAGWRGVAAAPGFVAVLLLLAACARQGGPAPVILGTEAVAPPVSAMPPPAVAPPAEVTVQRGQSLSGIARTYHVSLRALAEANRLPPPYRIVPGQVLVIPGAGASPPAPIAVAALPRPPQARAPAYAPPSEPRPVATPVAAERRPTEPTPPRERLPAAARLAGGPPAAETPSAKPAAEARPATAKPPPALAAAEPHAEKRGGGNLLWPVRGRIIARFGTGSNGAHNDGINIAAPRGAAIEAVDGGTVAYVGNQLRGYGNLILVKHPNGWISAYAHCDMILVRRGQKVRRGQTIARVGTTGNVSEPQLHFELRRGDHPVDPLDFLAPLPTAGGAGGPARG
jgi:murein DD-endopeptidase MepM/ murein hydrolase activator NlpD